MRWAFIIGAIAWVGMGLQHGWSMAFSALWFGIGIIISAFFFRLAYEIFWRSRRRSQADRNR